MTIIQTFPEYKSTNSYFDTTNRSQLYNNYDYVYGRLGNETPDSIITVRDPASLGGRFFGRVAGNSPASNANELSPSLLQTTGGNTTNRFLDFNGNPTNLPFFLYNYGMNRRRKSKRSKSKRTKLSKSKRTKRSRRSKR